MRIRVFTFLTAATGCGARDVDVDSTASSVPPVPLHTLSPTEYDRAISDLLGVRPGLAQAFVAESAGRFDNTSDDRHVTGAIAEQYVRAAEDAVRAALAVPDRVVSVPFPVDEVRGAEWISSPDSGPQPWAMVRASEALEVELNLPFAGAWTVTVAAVRLPSWRDVEVPTPGEDPVVRLRDHELGTDQEAVVDAVSFAEPDILSIQMALPAGSRRIQVNIVSDGSWLVAVDRVSATGVPDDPADLIAPIDRYVLPCDAGDPDCRQGAVERFARRAWRRPLADPDRTELLAAVDAAIAEGRSGREAVALALTEILTSPAFLFRLEPDDGSSAPARELDGYEVAARLALFLWSSVPDDELLDCAAAGQLGRDDAGPCGLDAQVDRMLGDARASALVDGFLLQWLGVAHVDQIVRDPENYAGYTSSLGRAMIEETRRSLAELTTTELPIRDLAALPFTWMDDRLAALYGRADLGLVGFTRVPVRAEDAIGVLGQASVLAATSQPSRTSVVARGVWVLDRLRCEPPSPPPAAISFDEVDQANTAAALDAHQEPACRSCHAEIDPVGVALEGADAIGAPRATYPDGSAVLTSGTLPDGTPLEGPGDLKEWILRDSALTACAAQNLISWALARRVASGDPGLVDLDPTLDDSATLHDLARAITRTRWFLTRATEGSP